MTVAAERRNRYDSVRSNGAHYGRTGWASDLERIQTSTRKIENRKVEIAKTFF